MDPEITGAVEARLLEFVDRLDDVVGVCDDHGRVLYLNQSARKVLGVGDATDLTTADFFAPEAFASYYDEVRPALLHTGTWSGELPIRTQTGDSLPMHFSVVARVGPAGEIGGMVTHGRPLVAAPGIAPIDDAPETATLAIIDRAVVADRIGAFNARGAATGSRVAVVYAELRDMRGLFERHGGFIADGVIRAVGRRLTSAVRASDVVARIGRNAFLVVYADVRDASQAVRLTQALHEQLTREPVWSAAGELSIALRFGLALAEPDEDPAATIDRAQLGTGTAPPARRPAVLVSARGDVTTIAACDALRPAVMHGDVRTFVRKVVAPDGRVLGFDAFPRWSDGPLGTLEAEQLDELATRAGVASTVNLRVLREAAAFVMTSPAESSVQVFAAMSEALLRDAYVEQYLWEVADALGFPPSRISLLVDHALIHSNAVSVATLRSLRETGARIVASGIDERTDLISLVADYHLADLRLSGELIRDLEDASSTDGRLERICTLVHDLGARVFAPAIHNARQHEFVRALGVAASTGEYYGEAIATESMG